MDLQREGPVDYLPDLPQTVQESGLESEGKIMKELPLTQSKFALVDDDDYPYLISFKWYAVRNGNAFYAMASVHSENGKRTTITMHRLIIKSPNGMVIDHIDGNGLNNQKSNLRIVTNRENFQNRHGKKEKTSKYPGVYKTKSKTSKKWAAQIQIDGKIKYLGTFEIETDAAQAYKNAVPHS